MTLEEAIRHCEEVAEENEQTALYTPVDFCGADEIDRCAKCAAEHRQLAEWLKELQAFRRDCAAGMGYCMMDGRMYVTDKPTLKSVHKSGECVIGGFREVKQ